jgi:hypothetical protein
MAQTPNQIDQQRRVISETQADVRAMLDLESRILQRLRSAERLGLAADGALDEESFSATGTDAAAYRAALAALAAFQTLDPGVWVALEQFAR